MRFAGHASVRSNHASTIEVTRDLGLTPGGDCIVGVGASSGCAGLPGALKGALRRPGARVTCTISAGGYEFDVRGRGDPGLALEDPGDIVLRRSGHVCPRTLAVGCDAAARDIPREIVAALRDPAARGSLTVSVDKYVGGAGAGAVGTKTNLLLLVPLSAFAAAVLGMGMYLTLCKNSTVPLPC